MTAAITAESVNFHGLPEFEARQYAYAMDDNIDHTFEASCGVAFGHANEVLQIDSEAIGKFEFQTLGPLGAIRSAWPKLFTRSDPACDAGQWSANEYVHARAAILAEMYRDDGLPMFTYVTPPPPLPRPRPHGPRFAQSGNVVCVCVCARARLVVCAWFCECVCARACVHARARAGACVCVCRDACVCLWLCVL